MNTENTQQKLETYLPFPKEKIPEHPGLMEKIAFYYKYMGIANFGFIFDGNLTEPKLTIINPPQKIEEIDKMFSDLEILQKEVKSIYKNNMKDNHQTYSLTPIEKLYNNYLNSYRADIWYPQNCVNIAEQSDEVSYRPYTLEEFTEKLFDFNFELTDSITKETKRFNMIYG